MERNAESCPMPSGENDTLMRHILGGSRTVAVVGMSPKSERPSNEVGLYLHNQGFAVIPVHPTASEISGLKAYPDLEAIPKERSVELVDLFVSGERTMNVVEQAARIGVKWVWFQPGSEDSASEARARELGLEVVSGRCTMAEHMRLFG